MADRTRQRNAAAVDAAQIEIPLDMLAVADWIRRLQHSMRLRQLLEALLRFGWAKRHLRGQECEKFASDEPPEDFIGEWWIKASKSELGAALGVSKTTIKRALEALPDEGVPPLLTIFKSDSRKAKRHTYALNISVIRTEEVDPVQVKVDPVQGGVDPVHEPGPEPGSTPLPPMGSLGIGSDGFLDSSGKLKPNPPQPKGDALIAWGRTLGDDDLTDVATLEAIFPRAVVAGYALHSEQDWLLFVALARYAARQKKAGNRPALFTALLTGTSRRKWDNGPWRSIPTNRDTDWAQQELKRRQQPARIDADVQSARSQVGQRVDEPHESIDQRKARYLRETAAFAKRLGRENC